MEQIKIYLCGPIYGLRDTERMEWRQQAIDLFGGWNDFKLLNPLRRNFRDTEFQSQNEIVQLDKADIINADILLVNATKPGWGTAMEVLFGFIHHKVIVAFTNKRFNESSPWLGFHATRIEEDLEGACEYIMKHFP